MAVYFEEFDGSPTVGVNIITGDAQGLRSFKIFWSDYGQFVYDLVGQWIITGTTATFVPASINFPGWPQLIVNDIKIKRFGGAPANQTFSSLTSATNSYLNAQVDVTYKPRQLYNDVGPGHHPGAPNVPNGTILDIGSKTGHEFLTVPGISLVWASDGKPLSGDDAPVGIRIASNAFTLKWSRVPQPPWSAMRSLEGLVNDRSFLGYPAGQVLFEGSDRDASFQINGGDLWTIAYNFKSRSQPWTKEYRADGFSSGFDTVNNLGSPLFASGNFAPLFQFGS